VKIGYVVVRVRDVYVDVSELYTSQCFREECCMQCQKVLEAS
jgi:hypothetical protein